MLQCIKRAETFDCRYWLCNEIAFQEGGNIRIGGRTQPRQWNGCCCWNASQRWSAGMHLKGLRREWNGIRAEAGLGPAGWEMGWTSSSPTIYDRSLMCYLLAAEFGYEVAQRNSAYVMRHYIQAFIIKYHRQKLQYIMFIKYKIIRSFRCLFIIN
jgi:hypothetical protein